MDDYTSNIFTTGKLGLGYGGRATGYIEVSRDEDWFQITLEENVTYEFELGGTLSSNSADEMLLLHDSTGKLVDIEFERSIIKGPLIIYTPDVSGPYFLGVRDFWDKKGSYTVSASVRTTPLALIEISSSSANFKPEGNSGATSFNFNVTRSLNTAEASSVNWAVASSSTASASDFLGGVLPSGTVQFNAGETSKIITVQVKGDESVEVDESFDVILSGVANATLGTAAAGGIIINDDSSVPVGIVLNGRSGNDTLNGQGGNDTLTGFAGDDRIDGGEGIDLANYSGAIAAYSLSRTGRTLTITDGTPGRDGTDTTTNLERLQFSDMAVNLTVQATAAFIPPVTLDRICELYLGFFARVPAADGLENWANQFRNGKSLNAIANDFYGIGSSPDLRQVTGYWDFANNRELSNQDFVKIAYRNVLGREGLDGGINYWATQLSGPEAKTRGELVATMLDAAQGLEGDSTWGWVADLLDDKVLMSKRIAVEWGLNYGTTAQQTIEKGMSIANSVSTEANPSFPAIPIKHFDFDAATALIGINPANIDLIA